VCVLARLNVVGTNTEPRWFKSVWLGRCTGSNEIFAGTATGEVLKVRSIKRLPPTEQVDKQLLETLKGTPAHPKGEEDCDTVFVFNLWQLDQLRSSNAGGDTVPAVAPLQAADPADTVAAPAASPQPTDSPDTDPFGTGPMDIGPPPGLNPPATASTTTNLSRTRPRTDDTDANEREHKSLRIGLIARQTSGSTETNHNCKVKS
jgi:hypothetical protein